MHYFGYASNVNTGLFQKRAGLSHTTPQRACLSKHILVFDILEKEGNRRANLMKHNKGEVYGLLYDLPEERIHHFSKSEPGYVLKVKTVWLLEEQKAVEAACFICENRTPGLKPARAYWHTIYTGARNWQFPARYLQYLEGLAPD